MIKSGLVSITFRQFSPKRIVELVAQAGLDGIEWGGDVHAPHGDLGAARQISAMMADHGLAVAAYGSYYQVGDAQRLPFEKVLDSAEALGAPTIRVWAGCVSSAEATTCQWNTVVADAQRIATLAAKRGMTISFEFHRQTMADTRDATVRLLGAVAHSNVRTYWQPTVGASEEDCLPVLSALLPWLSNVHVFHWVESADDRRFLAEGLGTWKRYLRSVTSKGDGHYALVEFVKGDAPESFLQDAATLRTILCELADSGKQRRP